MRETTINRIVMANDSSEATIYLSDKFTNSNNTEVSEEESDEEQEDKGSNDIVNDHKITGRFAPHDDFLDAMTSLRKFALELVEIDVTDRTRPSWSVNDIKIDGDHLMKQSRLTMNLVHFVKRTEKHIKVGPVSQVTLYPEADSPDAYHQASALAKAIDKVLNEAVLYLNGKYAEDKFADLPLFRTEEKLVLNFVK